MDQEKQMQPQQTTPYACEDLRPPYLDRTQRPQQELITNRLAISTTGRRQATAPYDQVNDI